ncbi:BlaI/MecI/CopY family transcriptional regulator [Lapidilactobacillus achengensis]|uniref:BlaI/MecI/CopY family transcriptional regulator n=1 Tax=Lapidilactobacillus achengensis TaxID=2486000 RepID=A0ABW1UL50_9LACO|nr:BlaI/MecI/CopY family transcriptional regulator [Lapidilactobacillus achengensis]
MKKYSFTKRELQVLQILWGSENALSAKEIAGAEPGLSQNTVLTVLKKLLASKFVETSGVTYSGTVLARQFTAVLPKEEYLESLVSRQEMMKVVSNFIGDSSDNELDALEAYIKEKRQDNK